MPCRAVDCLYLKKIKLPRHVESGTECCILNYGQASCIVSPALQHICWLIIARTSKCIQKFVFFFLCPLHSLHYQKVKEGLKYQTHHLASMHYMQTSNHGRTDGHTQPSRKYGSRRWTGSRRWNSVRKPMPRTASDLVGACGNIHRHDTHA